MKQQKQLIRIINFISAIISIQVSNNIQSSIPKKVTKAIPSIVNFRDSPSQECAEILVRVHLHVENFPQGTFLQAVKHLHLVSIQRIYPRRNLTKISQILQLMPLIGGFGLHATCTFHTISTWLKP